MGNWKLGLWTLVYRLGMTKIHTWGYQLDWWTTLDMSFLLLL